MYIRSACDRIAAFPVRVQLPKLFSLLLLASGALCALPAQTTTGTSVTASTATVTGRVFNAHSGTYLNNARVTVEGTSIEAFTDDSGTYRLRNVPAGPQRLRVRYTGQADIVETVDVKADRSTSANFSFNTDQVSADADALVLDEFIVKEQAFKNAQELAANEERFSTNIKSVVALDSLGHMTDGNIGDFVKFLPGVELSYGDAGGASNNPDNAMNVGVRGFGASDTAITIDGLPVSSAAISGNGALTRAFALDALSINNASRLEIIKVATPDMPQESPGGSINLITRGAFELPKATYNVSVSVNGNVNTPDVFKRSEGPKGKTYKTLPNIRASATIPLSSKLGITLSASNDNKYSYTYNTSMRDWFFTNRTVTIGGVTSQVANANGGIRIDNPVLERYQKEDNQWLEERYSGSARIDWKPFDGLEIRVNGQYSQFENAGVYRRTQWRYQNATGIQDWSPEYIIGRTRTSSFNPGTSGSITTDARDKEGFTTSGYITLKYRKGPWAIDGKVNASESYHVLTDRKNGHFSTVDASISHYKMDLLGLDKGVFDRIVLYNQAGEPINYGLSSNWNNILNSDFEARSSDAKSRDLQKLYQLDASYSADFLPFPLTLKAGALQRIKDTHKWGDGSGYKMRYIGPLTGVPTNEELQSDFATEAGVGYTNPMHWPDAAKIYRVYAAHPEWFDPNFVSATQNVNYAATNYQSRISQTKGVKTTNYAWYGMATASFFKNRLTVLGGVRQERRDNVGYNMFQDPKAQYIKDSGGLAVYRDSIYTQGVKWNGEENTAYAVGDPRRAADVILTDAALRARLQTAGVKFIPNQLELNPNGTPGQRERNLAITQAARFLRYIDTSITQPETPQIQVAYDITNSLKLQVAWSNETRIPEIEASTTGFLSGNSGFDISEPDVPLPGPGGDGLIKVTNTTGAPEEITSYNVKLAYYPKIGGKYAISWYYKNSTKTWESLDALPGDSAYDELLQSLGLSPSEYENYTINYTTATDGKNIRRGLEAEFSQNLGFIAPWAKGIDVYGTFTWRPASKPSVPASNVLGYREKLPDRNKWTGGVSYSARRFSIQARFIYEQSGITRIRENTVTMPDGTNQVVRYYRPNHLPVDLNLQANYVFNKHLTFFATFNRVISERRYTQEEDSVTGLQPGWASYRQMQDRGIAFSTGVNATF